MAVNPYEKRLKKRMLEGPSPEVRAAAIESARQRPARPLPKLPYGEGDDDHLSDECRARRHTACNGDARCHCGPLVDCVCACHNA